MTEKELKIHLNNRDITERMDLTKQKFRNLDLSKYDLRNIDFSWSDFTAVLFNHACLAKSNLSNCKFESCQLVETDMRETNLGGANLRYADLTGAHIEGANLYRALLEYAKLDGITSDERTKFFHLYCPEKGPFLGYKKCCEDRLVQLLIPADAKRTSATGATCRCSKAKVLTIKSFDYKENFTEAWSLVDPQFFYRVGEWVQVNDFNEDRWMDSTTGIHFWMTREEAKAY